jgi:nitroreductase
MDFFEVIKKRRTVRSYKKKKVPFSLIKKIISAGVRAPSAMNSQPWHFIVIEDQSIKARIRKIYEESRKELNYYPQDTGFVENSTLIVVCSESRELAKEYSCVMAAENLLLAATALNLGSGTIIAPLQTKKGEKKIRKLLKIPSKCVPLLIITIGYTKTKPKKKEIKEISKIVHLNKW